MFANWYRTHIYPTTEPDVMPPPDESTALLPEARPLNLRQKCYKFCYWSCCFVFLLLLLADMALSILVHIGAFKNKIILNDVMLSSADNVSALPTEEVLHLQGLEDSFVEGVVLNIIDTLICWIFLRIVARSPSFVGCFTILKNLIRWPRFWTLVFLLVLYIIGAVLALLLSFSIVLQSQDTETKVIAIMEVVMELLNIFTKLALVGVLNYVQVQNVASTRFNHWLLKGALVITWFSQFCTLIGAMLTVYISFLLPIATGNNHVQQQQVNSSTKAVMELLLLPFLTRTTELIWTKIFQDDKCIIGKYESSS